LFCLPVLVACGSINRNLNQESQVLMRLEYLLFPSTLEVPTGESNRRE